MKNESSNKLFRRNALVLLAASAALGISAEAGSGHTHGDSSEVYELEDFVVVSTGTRTERLLTEVPIKTNLLGSDVLESAGIFELGQAIELLNGARTESNCQNCGTTEIQLLGLPGEYNQVLVDGLPLFTGVASVYGVDQVPTLFVDRIEIVKGGGSALYGPGAVAGVINLIPEEPYETHTHAESNFSSIDGEPASVSQFASYYTTEGQRFKASLYGLYGKQNEYDRDDDGFTELVERENSTIGTYMWWTPYDNTRIRFNYQYIGEDRRGGDRLGVPNEFAQISEHLETDYHWSTLRWDQELTDKLSFNLSASAVYLDRDSFYGGTGEELVQPGDPLVDAAAQTYNGAKGDGTVMGADPADVARAFALFGDATDGTGGGSFNQFGELESTSYFVDAQVNYDLGELGNTGTHNLIFGFQYEYEEVTDDNVNRDGDLVNVLQDDEFDNFGVFFQDEWAINETLEFLPGIRFDKASTLDDLVISPRIAIRYIATDELTLRANYSTGFLAPRVFSEDTHVNNLGGQPIDIVNSSSLTEESSQTFSVGADFTPQAFDGYLVTALQVYYTKLNDSFFVEAPGAAPVIVDGRIKVERTNTDGTSAMGAEWDLSYRFDDNWSANIGLAYARTRYDKDQEIFDGVFTDQYNKTPDWSGIAQLNYDNPDLIDAYVSVKWTGTMEVANSNTETLNDSQDFYVVDLGISKTFAVANDIDLTLRAGVKNLFDTYQDDIESGASRDSTYVYGPRYPRTVTVGARIDF